MKLESRILNAVLRVAPSLLLTLAYAGVAQAQPIMALPCASPPANRVYSIEQGTTPGTDAYIKASDVAEWTFPGAASDTCSAVGSARACSGLSVTLPATGSPDNKTPKFTGTADTAGTVQKITIKAVSSVASADLCSADFTVKTTSSAGSGWGDPHLTTVDGVKYDFQSAGEFTALREDGFEVQTRQTPVPTASVPITNAYTGITHCVAIYTAVAAKLGTSRVTVQPSAGGEANASTMLVRVNGQVIELGDAPFVLHAGGENRGAIDGTITKHPDGMFEITDAFGTQLVVTSAFWNAHKVWYLNVSVYRTSAHEGTMGKLAAGSWLPALPDGTSLGAKPASESDRYQALYEKFADAWRVTDKTSLFDYEQGTKTATFTRDEWPRNHPKSCAIDGQTSAEAATEEVAQKACAKVVNALRRADCVFDVMVTGNAGFGKSYEVAQRFTPIAPGWYSPVPLPEPKPDCPKCKDCPPPTAHPWWCSWLAIGLGLVLLVVLVLLLRRKK